MAYEQRDNSGALFKNTRRTTDKHPTHTGTIMVAGVEYWFDGWAKKDKNGNMFMSVSVKPKQKRDGDTSGPTGSAEGASGQKSSDLSDDIPW